ncbi:EamA family transporter [Deltaproteobacteria bacterium Smac51]|nr:EamA family transporter [Deltaproteobacteria bacterium Smac51]
MLKLSRERTGFIVTVISAFAFASKTILAKMSYQYGVDAVTVLALRMIFAGAIFACVMAFNLLRGRWKLAYTPGQWFSIILLGVVGYYFSAILDFSGLMYIDASLGRMILFLYPTFVVIINAVLKRQGIHGSTWLALGLCYAGIGLMMLPGIMGHQSANIWLGSGLICASALVYACYLIGVDRLLKVIEPAQFTSMAMCVSCLSVLVHFLATRPIEALLAAPEPVIFNCFLMGTFSTVLPIYALTFGISRIGSAKAAMISMIGPVLTLIMGVLLLNESLTAVQSAGMALVMIGVWRVK